VLVGGYPPGVGVIGPPGICPGIGAVVNGGGSVFRPVSPGGVPPNGGADVD
jgi:hypothetical protein